MRITDTTLLDTLYTLVFSVVTRLILVLFKFWGIRTSRQLSLTDQPATRFPETAFVSVSCMSLALTVVLCFVCPYTEVCMLRVVFCVLRLCFMLCVCCVFVCAFARFVVVLYCIVCTQVVKLHSPSEGSASKEIGRTEIISNNLDPEFVTIVPVVSGERTPRVRYTVVFL